MTQQRQPTNIYELMNAIENPFQKRSLEKITHDEWADQRLYLTGYEKNTTAPYNLEGTFTVLGSLNNKDVRETYSIKFFKEGEGERGTFWCSCPDHKFNSQKKNMVCKHICFIVCRFGQVYDLNYFNTKQLTGDNYAVIKQKAEGGFFTAAPLDVLAASLAAISVTATATATTAPPEINYNTQFTAITKELSEHDNCPICFDEMTSNINPIICCPDCHNNMHKECMEVWLERNNTCVYCRSTVWRSYK